MFAQLHITDYVLAHFDQKAKGTMKPEELNSGTKSPFSQMKQQCRVIIFYVFA